MLNIIGAVLVVVSFLLFMMLGSLQLQINELKAQLQTFKNLRQMDIAYLESRIDKELKK